MKSPAFESSLRPCEPKISGGGFRKFLTQQSNLRVTFIPKIVNDRWHQLSISRQLILLVNAILIGLVGTFLVVDYRIRMSRLIGEKQIALTEEAKTMYEALLVAEAGGDNAIQRLVDNVCARMNTHESPGHHVAAQWRGLPYQAISHGHASEQIMADMKAGANDSAKISSILVGSFSGTAGTVYISEHRLAVVKEVRQSLLRQTAAVMASAAIAALVVSIMLRQLVAKPIEQLVSALNQVAAGDLSVMAHTRSCKELSYLAGQINLMTKALEHARRDHRVHMDKARQIQQNLRPNLTRLIGLDVAEIFEPAEDVGGDYYDVIELPDARYLLCVADVSGHGVPAAMAATFLKAFVSEAAKTSSSPAEILTRVNKRFCETILQGHFATMTLLVIDPKERQLTYANAGHELPFLQIGSETPLRLHVGDLVLGVMEDISYSEETVSLGDAARLVIVSDGVTEAFDPDEHQYGTKRIEQLMSEVSPTNARDLVEQLAKSLTAFRNGRKAMDDTTLLVAQLS